MRDQSEVLNKLSSSLSELDVQFRWMPIETLSQFKQDIETVHHQGKVGDFIDQHYMHYDFEIPADYQSIFIASYPQPHAKVGYETDKGIQYATIPSGYHHSKWAAEVHEKIRDQFGVLGIQTKEVHLPYKLLGARSGLTKYGKNNISYVETYGSQHRLVAYYTDLKVDGELFQPSSEMDICMSCGACVSACPFGAIPENEFLLDPNKCLSFYLDLMDPLPEWSQMHKIESLIGCTLCQDCCPMNAYFENQPQEILATLSKAETEAIIAYEQVEAMPEDIQHVLKQYGFDGWYELFRRNLMLNLR